MSDKWQVTSDKNPLSAFNVGLILRVTCHVSLVT